MTEFKKGDVIRVLRNRNAYGEELEWRAKELKGEYKIKEEIDVNLEGVHGNWIGYVLEGTNYWVRSDDIELVSRPSSTNDLDSLVSDRLEAEEGNKTKLPKYKELLEGSRETTNCASFCFTRDEGDGDFDFPYSVNIHIEPDLYWPAEDLRELADHLEKLARRIDKKVAKRNRDGR